MGWCGGTSFFDGALDLFLEFVPEEKREELIEKWYDKISEGDWDCESESDYFVPYIVRIMLKREELDDETAEFYRQEYGHLL
jgi:hypothetical protein